jgi:hypothetical protein
VAIARSGLSRASAQHASMNARHVEGGGALHTSRTHAYLGDVLFVRPVGSSEDEVGLPHPPLVKQCNLPPAITHLSTYCAPPIR